MGQAHQLKTSSKPGFYSATGPNAKKNITESIR